MFSTHVEGSNWRGCVSRCKNPVAARVSNSNDSGQDKWAGGKWCTAGILCYLFTPGCANNRPFPSFLVPLFQSESKCKTILMKMTLICMKTKLRAELIFIWKVSHLDSFRNRGTRELGNGLLWLHPSVLVFILWIFPSFARFHVFLRTLTSSGKS